MSNDQSSRKKSTARLMGAVAFLAIVMLLSITATAQSFPRCISGCTANDVELVEVTADVLGSCTPGGTVETNLWVSLYFNRNKTYCVRFVADVYIDGELAVADLVSEPLNVFSNGSYPDIYFGTVSVPGGSSLSLEDVQIMWSVNKAFKNVSSCEDGSCEPYGPGSKCTGDQFGTIIVSLPLDALDDVAETNEETPVDIDLLANDLLGVEPTLVTRVENGLHGSTHDNGDGTITYTPEPDFEGTDTFTYTIGDNDGNYSSATVTVIVYPTNDSPTAVDDLSETDESESVRINVLANDGDADGNIDPSSVSIIQNPAQGTLDVDPSTGVVTYLPSNGNCGSDEFSYVVSDNEDLPSNEARVLIDIRCNESPSAQDDAATTDENTAIAIDVAANDSDHDGSLDLSSIQITRSPSLGSVSVHPSSGVVTYMPDPLSCGDDTFSYTIADDDGALSEEADVVIAVLCDDPPLAIDDLYHVSEGATLDVNSPGILQNDIRTPDDDLSATLVSDGSHGILTLNSDGSFVYVHDGSETTSDQFSYYASTDTKDSNLATVSLIIQPVNDPPIAINDVNSTSEDSPITISVLINDSDPDGDVLFVDWANQPANGSVSNNGSSITYAPDPDFFGTDTFTYASTDGSGGQAEATVTIHVTEVNDPPVAQDDSDSTEEDTPVVIDVLFNDSDPDGDELTIQIATQPSNSSVLVSDRKIVYSPNPASSGLDTFMYTVSDNHGGTSTASVTVAVAAINDPPIAQYDEQVTSEDTSITVLVLFNDTDPEGDALVVESISQPRHGTALSDGTSVIYTPDPDYVGDDAFTYTVSDYNGGTSTATVSIDVLPVNDTPVAQDDAQVTQEDAPISILVLSNDSDPDGDPLRIESINQPAHGVTSIDGSQLVYTPSPEFSGSDSFTYTISDGRGGSDSARVAILVETLNDPPIAQNDSASTNESELVTIPVLANDSDIDGDFLLIESFTQPQDGSILNARTSLSYVPDPGFHGIDSFTYIVTDGNGGSSRATVTISVAEVNDAPIAQDDSAITDEGDSITILSLLNDSDPDGDPIIIESVGTPDDGIATIAGDELIYTPDAGFNGVDTFTYRLSDGRGGTSTATVFVAVAPVNDAPIAQDDSVTTLAGAAASVPVLVNDADPDGDPLTLLSVTQPAHGTVTQLGSELLYESDEGFIGADAFTYTITDGSASTSTATVTVGVDPLIAGSGGAADDSASCEGRVIISEIAWAGTTADSRDEWIELRNLGASSVNLDGWILRWRSSHPSTPDDQIWKVIELSGTLTPAANPVCGQLQDADSGIELSKADDDSWIVSGQPDVLGTGYYVLERRNNNTIEDVRANQLYDTSRTLSLELSDLGEIVMLVNEYGEIVDTANASNLGRNGWVAGSASTRGSMERIDPLQPDTADNWQTNFGLVIEGEDADGHPLRATPGIANSPDLETSKAIASIDPVSVQVGEVLTADLALTRQDRRASGWPWISVIRPGFAGVSGAGGSADYTAYAFSGSHESNSLYALNIDTSSLATGTYSFWIIYASGEAVYIPVIVSP